MIIIIFISQCIFNIRHLMTLKQGEIVSVVILSDFFLTWSIIVANRKLMSNINPNRKIISSRSNTARRRKKIPLTI